MEIIATIIPTYLVSKMPLSLSGHFLEIKGKNHFPASWWSGNNSLIFVYSELHCISKACQIQ